MPRERKQPDNPVELLAFAQHIRSLDLEDGEDERVPAWVFDFMVAYAGLSEFAPYFVKRRELTIGLLGGEGRFVFVPRKAYDTILEWAQRNCYRGRKGRHPLTSRRPPREREAAERAVALFGRQIKERLLQKDKDRRDRLSPQAQKTKKPLTHTNAHTRAAKIVQRLCRRHSPQEKPPKVRTIAGWMTRYGTRRRRRFSGGK
jgi:hypothetical protein